MVSGEDRGGRGGRGDRGDRGGGGDEAGERTSLVESAREGVRVVVYAMFGGGAKKRVLAEAVLEVLEGWGGSEERSIRDVAARHRMSERWLRVNVARARKRMSEVVERMNG